MFIAHRPVLIVNYICKYSVLAKYLQHDTIIGEVEVRVPIDGQERDKNIAVV